MFKNALIAIVFLGAGFVLANFFHSDTPIVNNVNSGVDSAESTSTLAVKTDACTAPATMATNHAEVTLAPIRLNPKTLANPENPYDAFRILVSLDSYSAEELKELLLNTSKDKKELRQQIVFLLVSKYPQEGFMLLGDAMNQNDSDLAKSILQSAAHSSPNVAWEWMQKNESDLDRLYGQGNGKKTLKMQALMALSKKPEYKILVTEEIQRLGQAGTSAAENFYLELINKNIANSDPEASINTALASAGGKADKDLFKGGLLAIADKDLTRAKDLLMQHPEFADASLIRQISSKLIENNQFGDAYVLVNKVSDPSLQRTTAATLAYQISQQGVARSIEFINALESVELKTSTVMSMSAYMSSNGQPVKDQLALFDEALKNVPIDKKAFNYAYTINNWSKKDAAASSQYLTELASSNKPLADEVQKSLDRLKKNTASR